MSRHKTVKNEPVAYGPRGAGDALAADVFSTPSSARVRNVPPPFLTFTFVGHYSAKRTCGSKSVCCQKRFLLVALVPEQASRAQGSPSECPSPVCSFSFCEPGGRLSFGSWSSLCSRALCTFFLLFLKSQQSYGRIIFGLTPSILPVSSC